MVAIAQCFLHFFYCHFSIIVQSMQLANKFLVTFALLDSLQFLRLHQMLGQPLAVAQAQTTQHVEDILK